MKIRSAAEIEKACKKKGFVMVEKGHHRYLNLVVDGKKTAISTYLSHNGQDYGPKLMSLMKKQMGFSNTQDMENYLNCTLSEKAYVKILRDANKL